ncbi:MAG: hypothetical protein DWH82_00305 [Planctomycetota bacterium]|nr:MAG: hypothetical protein DWH82_00305 [Planctomycetota bacterium]
MNRCGIRPPEARVCRGLPIRGVKSFGLLTGTEFASPNRRSAGNQLLFSPQWSCKVQNECGEMEPGQVTVTDATDLQDPWTARQKVLAQVGLFHQGLFFGLFQP